MMMSREAIDCVTVSHALQEVLCSLDATIASVKQGVFQQDGDSALGVELGNILSHICLTWNRRTMGPDDLLAESQDDYDHLATLIPNWNGEYRLIEAWDVNMETVNTKRLPVVQQETIVEFLNSARECLVRSSYCDAHDVGSACSSVLMRQLDRAIRNICLAWHLRYVSRSQVNLVPQSDLCTLGETIPQWDLSFRFEPERREA